MMQTSQPEMVAMPSATTATEQRVAMDFELQLGTTTVTARDGLSVHNTELSAMQKPRHSNSIQLQVGAFLTAIAITSLSATSD